MQTRLHQPVVRMSELSSEQLREAAYQEALLASEAIRCIKAQLSQVCQCIANGPFDVPPPISAITPPFGMEKALD